ncbi:7361_t:CDS:2, partial [Racocetra persica]
VAIGSLSIEQSYLIGSLTNVLLLSSIWLAPFRPQGAPQTTVPFILRPKGHLLSLILSPRNQSAKGMSQTRALDIGTLYLIFALFAGGTSVIQRNCYGPCLPNDILPCNAGVNRGLRKPVCSDSNRGSRHGSPFLRKAGTKVDEAP